MFVELKQLIAVVFIASTAWTTKNVPLLPDGHDNRLAVLPKVSNIPALLTGQSTTGDIGSWLLPEESDASSTFNVW